MNLEQCLAVAKEIEETYLIPRGAIIEQSPSGRNLSHLRWMVSQMRDGMSENKAMRWLGYIQGFMVFNWYCSLDDMKKLSMKHTGSRDAEPV